MRARKDLLFYDPVQTLLVSPMNVPDRDVEIIVLCPSRLPIDMPPSGLRSSLTC